MDTSKTPFSAEDGDHLIHELLYNPQAWGRFLMETRVRNILSCAIHKHGLKYKVSVDDLGNSFYLYSQDNNAWLTNDKDSSKIYSYFSTTLYRLLGNRKFLKEYLGLDIKMPSDPLPPVLHIPDSGEESSSSIAAARMEDFQKIICDVSEDKPDCGELLERYYLEMEDIRDIAADFLSRGIVKSSFSDYERALDAAENNLQTRRLNTARAAFNKIADSKGFPFSLNGKVKKSEMLKAYSAINDYEW